MNKRTIAASLLALLLLAVPALGTTLTGTIKDAQGNNIGGSLWFELSQNANVLSSGGCGGPYSIGPNNPIVFTLTAGQISGPGAGPYSVVGNDCITPTGTFYRMTAINTDGTYALRKSVSITGVSVDIGTLPAPSGGGGTTTSSTISGDVTGTLNASTVSRFQGRPFLATTPTTNQVISYNGSAWAPATLAVSGSGASYNVAFWSNSSNLSSDSALYWDNVNKRLGVGTSSPTSPLTVNGTIEIKSGSAGVLKFQDGTTQNSAASGGGTVNGTGTDTYAAFWTASSTISKDSAFVWDYTNHRLGLGIGSPTTRLDVNGTVTATAFAGPLTGAVTGNVTGNVSGTAATVTGAAQTAITSVGTLTGLTVSGSAAFDTSSLKVDAVNHRVGAGTASPGSTLDVKGTLRLSGATSGYVGLAPATAAGSTTYTLPSADGSANQVLQTNGSAVLSWATPPGAGSVGITGTPSAGQLAYWTGAASVGGNSNNFWDNANNRLGLLQTAPIATLHIGAQTTAPTLTSDILIDKAGAGYITVKNTTNSTEAALGADATGAYVGSSNNVPVRLMMNNAEKARIDTSGQLGLGMTPARALDVSTSLGFIRGKAQDYGGQVFNVKAYGAVGDGSNDDTTAIGSAITAAAAISPRGVVFFPPGTYKTTGNYSLDGLSGLQIIGSGVGSTVIDLNHATNDLFYTTNTPTYNLKIGGFTVTSVTAARTAGWVFHVNTAYNGAGTLRNSRFFDIEIQKQLNGLWIAKYEFVWIERVLGWNWVQTGGQGGVGIKFGQTTTTDVNQGSEAYVLSCQMYGTNLAGGAAKLDKAYVIEDTDAVYFVNSGAGGIVTNNLKVIANSGGHSVNNLFLDQFVSDATVSGDGTWFAGATDGTFRILNVKISNSNFGSAGQQDAGSTTPSGLRVDGVAYLVITGSSFGNNKGPGLKSNTSFGTMTGCKFHWNGLGAQAGSRDNIYVQTYASGLRSLLLVGNYAENANRYDVASDANSNKLAVTGNIWITGTSYGVAPQVNANNGS